MGVDLTIGTETFNYPTESQEPGWGSDATGWAIAVTEAIAALSGAGTISETQSLINNNQVLSDPIAGLVFSDTLTQSALVVYRIQRDSSDISPLVEMGQLNILFDDGTWKLSREILAGNPAGVVIDVNSTGQVVYTSSNIPDTLNDYSGVIKFKTIGVIS